MPNSAGTPEKISGLEEQLSAAQSECESLNNRLAFIASVIEAKPEPNSGTEKFRKLLDEDYQKYANQNSSNSSSARAMKTLLEVGNQLELVARDSQILGKNIAAIGGAFSSGKSSFMNSFFNQDEITLPVGMDQTTAIASYVMDGENTEITGYSYKGARVAVPENIFSLFTYQKKDKFKLNMKLIIDDIVFKTGFVQPYENICFIDTPGFNPGSNSEFDYNTAITAIAGAQILLWCFDVSLGTIHDDEFQILQDILSVNPDLKIYVIANRADLKSNEENAEVLDQVEMMLEANAIEYEGMSLYCSTRKFSEQPDEYVACVKGKTLPDFLAENNKPDTRKEEDLLKLVRGIFDEYIAADDEQIKASKKKIQESKSINSRFEYVLGKKDEIISDIKSRLSQKDLEAMGSSVMDSADDTEDDVDAVSEIMEENMRSLKATLQKATDDKSAAEELCRKFEECIAGIFGDRELLGKIKSAAESKPVAADLDDPAEQYKLGEQYYRGDGVIQDYAEALQWFMKAAEQELPEAQNRVGDIYRNGQGVEQDYAEAVKWYRKAADEGSSDAQNSLASMYFNGYGVAQNYGVALKWFQKSAKRGNIEAQNSMGNIYRDGLGVQQDFEEALKWYQKSADQGNADAQNSLGGMYLAGNGVDENASEALKWYQKSANQGNANAQNSLGNLYHEGQGTKQNYAEALKWYLQSANQGNADAQNSLGNMYYSQEAVAEDPAGAGLLNKMKNIFGKKKKDPAQLNYAEAAKWYLKAAEQGNADAQQRLGDMYEEGQGVEQNDEEAWKWHQKASEQGKGNLFQDEMKLSSAVNAMSMSISDVLMKQTMASFDFSLGIDSSVDPNYNDQGILEDPLFQKLNIKPLQSSVKRCFKTADDSLLKDMFPYTLKLESFGEEAQYWMILTKDTFFFFLNNAVAAVPVGNLNSVHESAAGLALDVSDYELYDLQGKKLNHEKNILIARNELNQYHTRALRLGLKAFMKELGTDCDFESPDDKLKEIVKAHLSSISKGSSVYMKDDVGSDDTKLRNALSTYAAKVRNEDVIGFIDTSLFSNGKNGLLFAKGGVCYNGGLFTCPDYLHYDEIAGMSFNEKHNELKFIGQFEDKNEDDFDFLNDIYFNLDEVKQCIEEIRYVV